MVHGQGVHSFYFLGASIFNSLPLSLSLRNINSILRNINSLPTKKDVLSYVFPDILSDNVYTGILSGVWSDVCPKFCPV